MKQISIILICLLFALVLQAQITKTVKTTAGNLSILLTPTELATVTDLILTGTMDARDFKTMRDSMPVLAVLDMSHATIVAYTGTNGTYLHTSYPIDYNNATIPQMAFQNLDLIPNTTLTSVKIPLNTQIIEQSAFGQCHALNGFTIPASVKWIMQSAFAECIGLTAITIPSTVTFLGWDSFEGCTGLTKMIIPPSINEIKEYLFSGCTGLTSVELPSTLITIENKAFADCSSLVSLNIPDAVVSIGSYAFAGCSALESLNIPASLTSIGEGAYDGLGKWKGSLNLPKGLNNIEALTFRNCINLSSVQLPSSLDSIRASAFEGCTGLSGSLILPPTLKLIGSRAFYNCSHLTGPLLLPESLSFIGFSAFNGCNALKGELIVPPNISTVENHSFAGCSGFTSLTIPATVDFINSAAFAGCSGLTVINSRKLTPVPLIDVTDVFEGVDKTTTTLHVPFGSKEAYATARGWNEFRAIIEDAQGLLLNVTTLHFDPEGGSNNTISLKANVAWTALSDQSWLRVSPTSGNSTQLLMVEADANTSMASRTGSILISSPGLESQSILVTQAAVPTVVHTTTGNFCTSLTLEQWNSITRLVLTGTMNAPEIHSLKLMPLLSEVDMSGVSITPFHVRTHREDYYYAENSFPGNQGYYTYDFTLRFDSALTTIVLPSTLTDICNNAFEGCINLSNVRFPSSLMAIFDEAFMNCSALKNVELPPSLTRLGFRAFKGCSSLTSVSLPEGITELGGTFAGCTSLRNITLPSSLRKIDSETFSGCQSLISIEVPPMDTIIEYAAFAGCTALSEVSLPASLQYIGYSAFNGCIALTSITIPDRVTYIGPAAFTGCRSLEAIYAYPVQPPTKGGSGFEYMFGQVDKTRCVLYVPAGSKELYAMADDWQDFQHIVEMEEVMKLSDLSFTMATEGGIATVEVISATPWTSTSNQTWLTASPASGTGNAVVTIAAEANTTVFKRMGALTFTAGRQARQTIMVVQQGDTATITLAAGQLNSAFTAIELAGLQRLVIKGTMDARDFKTIRDRMGALTELDISKAAIVAYSGTEGTLRSVYYEEGDTIISSFDYPANGIPPAALCGNGKLITSIKLPPALSSIGASAFSGLVLLKELAIPTSVTSIGSGAFSGCRSLVSLTLPPALVHLPEYLCNGCGISSINIPSSVTSVGYMALGNCPNLTTLTSYAPYPPETLVERYMDPYVLAMNPRLTTIYVPYGAGDAYRAANEWKNIQNIREMPGFRLSEATVALQKDKGSTAKVGILSDVSWTAHSDQSWLSIHPSSGTGNDSLVLSLEANTMEAGRMAQVTVRATDVPSQIINVIQEGRTDTVKLTPGSLATAFTPEKLSGITHLTLTGQMDARDFRVLRDRMPLLTVLDLSDVTINEYRETNPLTKIITTYREQAIPDMAFYNKALWKGKESLTSVILPFKLEKIGDRAFADSRGLKEISLPSSIRFIEYSSFNNCPYLRTILSHIQLPPESYDSGISFFNVDKEACTLFIPKGTKALYAASDMWKGFFNIIELGDFRIMSQTAMTGAEQGSKTSVELKAQVPWQTTSDRQWLHVSPASGTGDQKIILTADANMSVIIRKATVTFTSPGYLPLFLTVQQTGIAKTMELTAGTLSNVLTEDELNGITFLVITGTMDVRDFRVIRSRMPELRTLDISGAIIVAYTENGGLNNEIKYYYKPNTIPAYAFTYSDNIKSQISTVMLPFNLAVIDHDAFISSKTITSVSFPASLTTIGSSAFSDTRSLTTAELTEGLDSIGYGAFNGSTALTTIKIPASVKYIGEFAFAADTSVTSIYSYARVPLDLKDSHLVFYDINKTKCTLFVPYGCGERYAQANQWKDFTNIVEMPGFELQQTTAILEAAQGSSAIIELKGNTMWGASCDHSWLTINPLGGMEDQMLILTAKANQEDTARMATVTVSTPQMESQTIMVTQKGMTTEVEDMALNKAMLNCHPNPFSIEMTIDITNPSLKEVSVEIFSISGQKIGSLVRAQKGAKISCTWDGRDESGKKMPSGMYLLKVNEMTRKIVKE